MVRASLADDVDLKLLGVPIRIRHKPSVVETQARVLRTNRVEWNRDLGPVGVDVTPENSSPFLVQAFQGLVTPLQPLMELSFAVVTKTAIPKLIINLPSYNSRIVFKMVRHLSYDMFGMLVIK